MLSLVCGILTHCGTEEWAPNDPWLLILKQVTGLEWRLNLAVGYKFQALYNSGNGGSLGARIGRPKYLADQGGKVDRTVSWEL